MRIVDEGTKVRVFICLLHHHPETMIEENQFAFSVQCHTPRSYNHCLALYFGSTFVDIEFCGLNHFADKIFRQLRVFKG